MHSILERNSKSLLPADPTEQKFTELFPYLWQWLYKPTEEIWTTETRYPLSPRDLIEKWRSPNEIVGVRFGNETAYLMLDIDAGSQYHPDNNDQGLAKIQDALETIGIVRSLLIRSSETGGLHLYLPLPENVNTYKLACTATHTLKTAKLELKNGQLEIFPNPKAYDKEYNGHRLPLQQSSYLLNPNLQPYSQNLKVFLAQWDTAAAAQDTDTLKQAIANTPKIKNHENNKPHSKAAEFKTNLQTRIATGWTGPSQTNEMLHQIGLKHRIFDGIDEAHQLAEAIAKTAKQCPGFYQYSQHINDLEQRATSVARSIAENPDYYTYGSRARATKVRQPAKDKKPNLIERVQQAIAKLKEQTFDKVRDAIEAIRINARCSPTSLYTPEIKELWQPLIKNCNSPTSNSFSDPKSIEQTEVKPAKTETESTVTVLAPNEVLEQADLNSSLHKINQTSPEPTPDGSKIACESPEPSQDKEYKQIMPFAMSVSIASTCKPMPIPERSTKRSQEPPRQNPFNLERVQEIVQDEPSKASWLLAFLKTKLCLPFLKPIERSQTEQAIEWLESLKPK
jgi:hypothetical protein